MSKKDSTVAVAFFPLFLLLGIGFAPIGYLYENVGLGVGVFFEVAAGLILIARYRFKLRSQKLLFFCSIPWVYILSRIYFTPHFSVLWLLKLYPFFYSWKWEQIFLKFRYQRPYKLIIPFGIIILSMHVLACGWLIIEKPYVIIDYTAYNKAFYWVVTTLTTVGYGDITPTNNWARLYTAAVMMLGVGVYGLVISQMSRLIIIQDKRKEAINEKLEHLTSFFKHYNIPEKLQTQTRAFYDHILEKNINHQEKELLADMPTSLKQDLQTYMVLKPISQTKLFTGCGIDDLKDVLNYLDNFYVSPKEVIFSKGDPGDSMYIIVHGHVDISVDGKHVAELSKNQIFGEMSMVFDENRNADAVATTYLDLFKLTKENFHKLIENHPKIKRNVDLIIEKRKQENSKK